jgi:hypothetical protein
MVDKRKVREGFRNPGKVFFSTMPVAKKAGAPGTKMPTEEISWWANYLIKLDV